MHGFHTKVSSNGRIIIPAQFRKELGIKAGDEVVISKSDNGEIRITSFEYALRRLQELARGKPMGTEELFKMRREETI